MGDTAGAFNLHQLATEFGLAPLARLTVAYCGEAELRASKDKQRILEVLKGITGEDTMAINRKFDPEGMSMTLPTRLVVACNELPMFSETVGALSRRLLLLRFGECFEGREDYGLKGKLLDELPGIALWALEGLKRLRQNGRFTISEQTKDAINEFKRDNSPEFSFVQDCLVIHTAMNPGNLAGVQTTDASVCVSKEAVQTAYRKWCEQNDREPDESAWQWFWRRMGTILPKLKDGATGPTRTWFIMALDCGRHRHNRSELQRTAVRPGLVVPGGLPVNTCRVHYYL